MNCKCHDEPCYWQRDNRNPKGGHWRCAVKKRDSVRNRYDNDPIHRITKNLKNDARHRRQTIERQRARLASDQED